MTQATGNQRDDLTMQELQDLISNKDDQIQDQARQIQELSQRVSELNKMLKDLAIGPATMGVTSTSTVYTNVLPTITSPRVVFCTSSSVMSPGLSSSTTVTSSSTHKLHFTSPNPKPNVSNAFRPVGPDLITIEDSESSSSESSSSENDDRNPLRGDQREMAEFAAMIGNKKCPKPAVYSLESGRSFSKFLSAFEDYCESRYSRARRHLWTHELSRFLEGEILSVYLAYGGPEKKYKKIKKHLENWHEQAKERIGSSRKAQYRSAKIQPGESLKLFATRLENLYRVAYPRKDIDGSDLKRQLLSSIPEHAGEVLQSDLAFMKATTKQSPTWGDVLRLLEKQDQEERRSRRTQSRSRHRSKSPDFKPWAGVDRKHLVMPVRTDSPVRRRYQSRSPKNYPRSPKNYPRSPRNGPSPRKSPPKCGWCRRVGHSYDYCRRRLNQCLACGSSEHFISGCPMRNPHKDNERVYPRRSATPVEADRHPVMSRPQSKSPQPKREPQRGRSWCRSKPPSRSSSSSSSENEKSRPLNQ